MKLEFIASALAALACHAWILLGLHVDTPAVPLPPAPTAIEVSLVAFAPVNAALSLAPSAPDPEPPAPEPEMLPPPLPESVKSPPESLPPPPEVPKPQTPVASRKPAAQATALRATGKTGSSVESPGGTSTSARPAYRYNPHPQYPLAARRERQQGKVILGVEVGANGRALSVEVRQSSGFPMLDDSAVEAVRRWTFEPARSAGLPIASRVEVPIRFSLSK